MRRGPSLSVFCSLLFLSTVAAAQQPLPVLQWGFWGSGPSTPPDYLWSNVPVHAAMPHAIAVAGGFYSAAALDPDGRVWTWGSNERGQLGDGTNTNRAVPGSVPGLDHVVAIAAGSYHVLALKDDHTVWAWGFNQLGQLGDGSRTNRNAPVQVTGLPDPTVPDNAVIDIAAGVDHSLALTADGRVFGWGSSQYGQLAHGGSPLPGGPFYLTATWLTSLDNVAAIDAFGLMSIAALRDGSVWTWGYNTTGALGDGTTTHRSTPVSTGLSNAIGVAAGGNAAAALLADGTVATWGTNNHGEVGDGSYTTRLAPVVNPNLTEVSQIDAGFLHMVALRQDGTVWVWGGNADWGQLGLGQPVWFVTPVPVQVTAVAGVRSISAGGESVIALGYLAGEITATITADGPLTFCEGESVTLTADGGSSYLWSNGATTQSIVVTASGSFFVTVSEGSASATSETVVVSVLPAPVATVATSGSTTFCTGESVTLTSSAGAAYHWSSGATTASITVTTSGSYSVTVTDGNGCQSPQSDPIAVTVNPLPAIAASAGSALEGGALALTGNATGMSAGGQVVIEWGDGSAAQTVGLGGGGAISAAHVFLNDGWYTVRLHATSQLGCSTESTVTAIVANAAPVISSLTASMEPTLITNAVIATAEFDDPGLLDTHTAEWSWGDGTTTVAPVTRGTNQSAHTYATPGVYVVTLRVVDNGGASATGSFEFVVIYDPNGGFVTGGGWIDSPAGAYPADPSLTGKANFGFVSKYLRGANTPTGETEFRFKAAGLDFHSTSYQWLVVAGPLAKFKGDGEINGAGDLGFMLSAVDGARPGGGGSDKFRIKIWDKATHAIIYDNQIGDGDDAPLTTVIGGGSIVIHD